MLSSYEVELYSWWCYKLVVFIKIAFIFSIASFISFLEIKLFTYYNIFYFLLSGIFLGEENLWNEFLRWDCWVLGGVCCGDRENDVGEIVWVNGSYYDWGYGLGI